MAKSGEVAVDPQVISNLLHALQRSQPIRIHPWNVSIWIAEVQDTKNRNTNATHHHHMTTNKAN